MRVHFVVHETYEAPGAYETWAEARGYAVSRSRVHAGEPLPSTIDDIDLLIVMGGPQSPSTTKEECPHFDAAAERALIKACVAANKAVVGVCLGAQLIGEALGAPFEHSPEKEIGKFPITMTPEGKADPRLSHFGDTLEVGHWHGDMPGLTRDARVLARSEGCPRQIIKYGDFVYGFQCHLEFTREVVKLLIAASEGEFATPTSRRFVQRPETLLANDHDEMNRQLLVFLDKLAADHAARR